MKIPLIALPSWVIPGTYLENIRFLESHEEVGAVELLFFFYDDETEALFSRERPEIEDYRHRFIFTAHLPDVLRPEHESLVEHLSPLVRHFIVHPLAGSSAEESAIFLSAWMDRYGKDRFLIENTKTSIFESFIPLLPPDTKLCMDCGHLLLEGRSPRDFFDAYGGGRIREIHLHGIDLHAATWDEKLPDHRSFPPDSPWFTALLPRLGDYSGIVNVEVFSWEEGQAGIKALGRIKDEALGNANRP